MLTHIGKNIDVGCKIINFVIIFFVIFSDLHRNEPWGRKHHFVFACWLSCLRKALKYQWSWQYSTSLWKAKSRKYQWVFEVKSRVKTWQVRGIWSQQLDHKQVSQWGTAPGVRKGKRKLVYLNLENIHIIEYNDIHVNKSSLYYLRLLKCLFFIYRVPKETIHSGYSKLFYS